MNLLTNKKLAKDNIVHFSLPSLKTCPGATPNDPESPCHVCYDVKCARIYPTVNTSREAALQYTKQDNFVDDLTRAIQKQRPKYFRFHTGGDFYSISYVQKVFEVARRNPSVKFYAYTKSHLFFIRDNGIEWPMPKNFRIIYSVGSKYDFLLDTSKHRHARMFDTKEELERAGYVDCSDSDLLAATTRSKRIGLVRH